ncbi:MAG: glycosyltransferase family 1 protein [Ignavibacteriaceae bacterium]
MNIGIDARILERKMTGIGRFLNTFLNELPSVDKKNKYYLFSYDKLNINDDYFVNIATGKSSVPQKLYAPFWMNFILPGYLEKNKIDLFFSVNQLTPLVKVKTAKYILVLHDVIYLVDKSFHPFIYRKYLQFFTYFSIKKSDLIVTVSEYSKMDILKYYNVPEDKIKVVYQAAEKEFYPMNLSENEKDEVKKMFGSPEHIVMYLGMIENRKNIPGIMKIADEVYKKNNNIKFLLIGKIGYGGAELLKEIEKRENVIYLKGVDDHLLKQLYNVSSLFLFPSFYEGFGYPPLEAMQSGLPVLASNNTSLKEIIGSGGILHEPDDYHSFSNDILKVLDDKEWYNKLKNEGIKRAKDFNITTTVKELVNIFNSVE